MSKEAMKLALEALEDTLSDDPYPYSLESKAITALREALAKPDFWEGYVPEPVKPAQQEPVAWGNFKEDGTLVGLSQHPEDQATWTNRKPLYTSPPAQRTWVGLTDEEVDEWTPEIHTVIRAIEAKLRERNT